MRPHPVLILLVTTILLLLAVQAYSNEPTLIVTPLQVTVGQPLTVTVNDLVNVNTTILFLETPSETLRLMTMSGSFSTEYQTEEPGTHTAYIQDRLSKGRIAEATAEVVPIPEKEPCSVETPNCGTPEEHLDKTLEETDNKPTKIQPPTPELIPEVIQRNDLIKFRSKTGAKMREMRYRPEEGDWRPLLQSLKERADIEIIPEDSSVKRIILENCSLNGSLEIGLEELRNIPEIKNRNTINGFALDPEDADFQRGELTRIATGKQLWKCDEWDFPTQTCTGEWRKIMDLTPGEEYTVVFDGLDPGFAETTLEILNVQSYPQVGGTWQVKFTTTGTADLVITAVEGTEWGVDLILQNVTCGNTFLPTSYNGSSYLVQNYSCAESGFETSRVVTGGKHTILFQFGNETAKANNLASRLVMEWGNLTAENETYETVQLQNWYLNPVVVATPQYDYQLVDSGPPYPMGAIVRNITNTSFEVKLDRAEADVNVDRYGIHYLVIEEGNHSLPSGTNVQAGKVSTTRYGYQGNNNWADTGNSEHISFPSQFVNPPQVFHTRCSENNAVWGVTFVTRQNDRINPPTNTGMAIGLNRGELGTTTGFTVDEDICWIAIDGNTANDAIQGINYTSGNSGGLNVDRYADENHAETKPFSRPFNSTPEIVMLASSTMNGGDGQWAVGAPASHTQSVWVASVEETQESDRNGNEDRVGYWAFQYIGSYDSNIAPTVINLTYPYNNSLVNDTVLDFNFTAEDDQEPMPNCSLWLNSSDWRINRTAVNIFNSTETNITVSLPAGAYRWNILCSDAYQRSSFYTNNQTFTYDPSRPKISNVRNTSNTETSVVIVWDTDDVSNSTVEFGLTTDLGAFVYDSSPVTSHGVALLGLNGSTQYFYNVTSCNLVQNCNTTGPFTFNTTSTPDLEPPSFINITASPSEETANIRWNTTEAANSSVNYGLTKALGTYEVSGSYLKERTVQLTSLSPLITYYYNLTSCDPAGNCNTTGPKNFTTVDITGPQITLVSPNPSTTNDGLTIDFTYSATDNNPVNISNCSVWYNYSGNWERNYTEYNLTQGQQYSVQRTFLPSTILWNVQCYDSSGNENWATNRSVTAQDSPMNITLVSPTDQFFIDSNRTEFTCEVLDDYGVQNVSLYTNRTGSWEIANYTSTSGPNPTVNFYASTGNGAFLWNCEAYDDFDQGQFSEQNNTVLMDERSVRLPLNISSNLVLPGTRVYVNGNLSLTDDTILTKNILGLFVDNQSYAPENTSEQFVSPRNVTPDWWDGSYRFRSVINITNNNLTDELPPSSTINISVDTSSYVSNGTMLSNGDDVRIVFQNETTTVELDRINSTPFNTANTVVVFRTMSSVSAGGSSGNYYIYYDNPNAVTPPTNADNLYSPFEAFNLLVDDTWQKVEFNTTYFNPVVVAQIEENRSPTEEAVVRIRNKDSTGFEVTLQNHNQTFYAFRNTTFFIMEEGMFYTFEGDLIQGVLIEDEPNVIGSGTPTATTYSTYSWPKPFPSAPSITTHVQSYQDPLWVSTHNLNVGATTYQVALELGQYCDEYPCVGEGHEPEDVGIIAFQRTNGNFSTGQPFATGITTTTINGPDDGTGCADFFNYPFIFSTTPFVSTTLVTRNGADGGWPAICSRTNIGFGIHNQEEDHSDGEQSHGSSEAATYIAVGNSSIAHLKRYITTYPTTSLGKRDLRTTRTNSVGEYNYTFLAPQEGEYNLTVNMTYIYIRGSNSTTLSVDGTPPKVSITLVQPDPAQFVYSNVSIEWTSLDLHPQYSYINVSYPNGTLLGQYPTNVSINITQLNVTGEYNITLFASDLVDLTNITSTSFNVIDTRGPVYFGETRSLNRPVYSPEQDYQFNITLFDPSNISNITFQHNFTGVFVNETPSGNSGGELYFNTSDLWGGNYSYRWVFNDTLGNSNNTGWVSFTVTRAPNSVDLFLNKTKSNLVFGYGNTINATGNSTGGTTTLFIGSGPSPTTPISNPYVTVPSAETYFFKANATQDRNYSAEWTGVTRFLIVNRNLPNLTLTLDGIENNISVGQNQNLEINGSVEDPEGDISLFAENLLINNGPSPLTNTTSYSNPGLVNITLTYAQTQNYTSGFVSLFVNVTDITAPTVTLLIPPNNTNTSDPVIFNWTVTDNYDGVLNCTLFLNGTLNETNILVANGTNASRTLFVQYEKDYSWNVTCMDDERNVGNSSTFTFQNQIPPKYSGITVSPTNGTNYTEGQQYKFNITWTDTTGMSEVKIENNFNGTLVNITISDIGGGVYNYTVPDLGAGTYQYRWFGTDLLLQTNQTEILTYQVNRSTPQLGLISNVSWSATYPDTTNTSCTITTQQVSTELFRNASSVSNPDVIQLGAGDYLYECNVSDTANYTNTTTQNTLTIQKANNPVTLLLNGTSSDLEVTYGAVTNASASATAGPVSLFRNGLPVSNPEVDLLPAGTWVYKVNTTGNQNYTTNWTGVSYTLTILRSNSSVNLTLNGVDGEITVAPGQSVEINGTLLEGVGQIQIFQNGSLINSGFSPLTNITTYTNPGDYNITVNYTGNQNYTNSSETHIITVGDTQPPVVTLLVPENESNQTGPVTFNWTVSDNFASQLNCSLYLNGTLNETNILVSNGTNASRTKTITFESVVEWNVTCVDDYNNQGNSTTYWFYNQIPPKYSDISINPNNGTNYTEGQQYKFNITWTDTTGMSEVKIENNFNGTLVNITISDIGGGVYNYTVPDLGAGTYQYRWFGTDLLLQTNQTEILTYQVNRSTPQLGLISNVSWSATYPDTTNTSCTISTTQTNTALYRNNTPTTNPDIQQLAAGTYQYTCNTTDTANYTNTTTQNTLTIQKANNPVQLFLNNTQGNIVFTYGNTVNATGLSAGGPSTLFSDGSPSPTTPVANPFITIPAAGTYFFKVNSTGNQNYTANSTGITRFLVVNRAIPQYNLSLNGNDSDITTTPDTDVTINASFIVGIGNLTIYRNSTELNSGPSPLINISSYGVGVWNITVNSTETQNYTAGSKSHLINAIDTTPPNITLIAPNNNTADSDAYINVTFNVSDNYVINNCSLLVNGSLEAVNSSITEETNQFFVDIGSGKYNFELICTDSYSNSKSLNFTIVSLYTVGLDGLTTSLTGVDFNSISGLILENTKYGLINYTGILNLSNGSNITDAVAFGKNLVGVYTERSPGLNVPANITIYNLSLLEDPVIFKNRSVCLNCPLARPYSGGNVTFSVQGFSNYSASENSQLNISDGFEEGSVFTNTQADFYANYSNITNGTTIVGAICNISFNVSPPGPFRMGFNSSKQLYEYNRSFSTSGTYQYNITCNGSSVGYEPLNGTDSIDVQGLGSINVTLHKPMPGELTNVFSNKLFIVNSTIDCEGTTTDTCGNISVNVLYNVSQFLPYGTGGEGDLTITGTNTVLNNYTHLTQNATLGSSTITVDDATNISAGTELLIIQQQNGTGFGKAGEYEFAFVSDVNGNTLTLQSGLENSYYTGTYDSSISTVTQVVTLRQFNNLTVTGSITSRAWNGYSGGVIAFRANGTVDISGSINGSNTGFRGGSGGSADGGSNGESYDGTRGKGGNDCNSGGINCVAGLGTLGGGSGQYNDGSSNTRGTRGGGGGGGDENGADGTNAGGGGGGGGYAGGGGGGGGSGDGNNPSGDGGTGGSTGTGGGGGGAASTDSFGGDGGNAGSAGVSNDGTGGTPGTGPLTGLGGGAAVDNADTGGSGGGGGGLYGTSSVSRLHFGSGGGGGGDTNEGATIGQNGGAGGGLVFIGARNITITGSGIIESVGGKGGNAGPDANPYGAGGGGAGGTILLASKIVNLGSSQVYATGGFGGDLGTGGNTMGSGGGDGGVGRVRVDSDNVTGTANPSEFDGSEQSQGKLFYVINESSVAVPFYTLSSQTQYCELDQGESCTLTWNINVTGLIRTKHGLFVNASSNYSQISTEISDGASVNITGDSEFPKITNVNLNTTLINQSETVQLNATVTDNFNISNVLATIRWPNGTYQNLTMNEDGPNYVFVISDTLQSGIYNITHIIAEDTAQNRNTTTYSTITFNVTSSPPTSFNLLRPVNNSVSTDLTPELNWTETVEEDFDNYTILIDLDPGFGSPDFIYRTLNDVSNTTFQITTPLVANVTYYWRVVAYDVFGSGTNSDNDFVYITDTRAPFITLHKPVVSTVETNSVVLFNYTPFDLNLENCTLYINATGWKPNQTNTSVVSGQPNYFSENLDDGNYTWNILCYDKASNNALDSNNNTFTVDTTPPNITLLRPANDTTNTTTNNIQIFYSVVDESSTVASCEAILDGNVVNTDVVIEEGIEQTFTVFINNGNHTWNINCTDTNGFESSSEIFNITVISPDNDPPVIVLNYPEVDKHVQVTNISFNYTPNDASGIKNCTLYLDGMFNTTNNTQVTKDIPNYFDIENITEGEHRWRVMCADNQTGLNDSSGTRNFTVDLSNPVVILNRPGDNGFEDSTVVFNYTPTETNLANCTIYTNETGVWAGLETNKTAIAGQHNYFRKTLTDGTYKWNVLCVDLSGRNSSALNNNTVNVDTTPPAFSEISVSPTSETKYVPGNRYEFNITWTDNYQVGTVQLENNFTETLQNITVSGTEIYNYTTLDLAPGTYRYRWFANDTPRGLSNQTGLFTYTVELGSPDINLTINGTRNNFTISDVSTLNLTSKLIAPATGQIELYLNKVLINSGDSPLTNITPFNSAGIYNVTAIYPSAGNYSEGRETWFINASDATKPNITLLSPDDNYEWNTSFTVTFQYNVSDNDSSIQSCELIIDDSVVATDSVVTEEIPQELEATLSNGFYNWSINCTSVFGAEGASETRTVEVNTSSTGAVIPQPDIGAPGMELAVQFVGSDFKSTDTVTTNSSDIVVGPVVVTDTSGNVASTGARTLTTTFFISDNAGEQDVEISIRGETLTNKFRIETPIANSGNFTGSTGTVTIGDGKNGTRTFGGTILLDYLIVPSGVNVVIDISDPDSNPLNGNQGLLPAIVVVDGPVNISGTINISGTNGVDSNAGGTGGAGGTAGPGGGGGGAGGSESGSNLGPGGNGFSGGGGGSNGGTGSSNGGNGTGEQGESASGNDGGDGGDPLYGNSNLGGQGGLDDATEGSPGAGGSGDPFGTQATAGPGVNTAGTGGAGAPGISGGACGGGGGGFATSGTDGTCSTDPGDGEFGIGGNSAGNQQLVPLSGGSGASGGSPDDNGVNRQGAGGGGGAGAIYIYGPENITLSGTIYARGGRGGDATVARHAAGGGGSGGTIILQSPNTTVTGTLDVSGGQPGDGSCSACGTGGAGSAGRVRVDGLEGTNIPGTNPSEFIGPSILSVNKTTVWGKANPSTELTVFIFDSQENYTTFAGNSNSNGEYQIQINTYDDFNYISVLQNTSGDTVFVASSAGLSRFDGRAPNVTLIEPEDGNLTVYKTINFTFRANDTDLDSCTLYHNATGWSPNQTNSSPVSGQEGSFSATFSDGTYKWSVVCVDILGNSRFANNRTFTINTNTPPTAFNLLRPKNNTVTTNLNPTLNWTPTTDAEFDNYTILIDTDSNFGSPDFEYFTLYETTNTTYALTTPLVANISYYWRVIAYDSIGSSQTNSTDTFVYITDTRPPFVTLNAPSAPTVETTSNIVFDYTPLDLNLNNCTLYLNDSGWNPKQTNTSVVSGQPNYFSETLDDGNYTWNILCTDRANNQAFSQNNKTFVLDTNPPNITLISPPNNTLNSSTNNIKFSYRAFDNISTVTSCEIIVDGDVEDSDSSIVEGATQDFTVFLSNGQHNWSINCTDGNGIEGASDIYNITTDSLDNDPPVITLNFPPDLEFVDTNNISFNYTPDDASDIVVCGIYIDGVFNRTNQTTVQKDQPNYFNIDNITEEIHNWSVQCADNVTPVNGTSDTYNFTVDITNPDVNLTAPNDLDFRASAVVFNYSAYDLNIANCSLYTNESGLWTIENTNFSIDNGGNNSFTRVLSDGTYTWNIYCSDLSGRVDFEPNRTLYVDTTPPRYSGITISPANPATYVLGQEYWFNITWIDNFEVEEVFFETNFSGVLQNVSVYNDPFGGGPYENFTYDLAPGTYRYRWFANDTPQGYINQTPVFEYVVNKGIPDVNTTINKTRNNVTLTDVGTVNLSAQIITPVSGDIDLLLNGVLLQRGVNSVWGLKNITSPGIYNVTGRHNGSTNYSSGGETWFIIANDSTAPNVSLETPENDGEWNTSFFVTFEYNVTDDDSTVRNCSLYINDTFQQLSSSITENVTQSFGQVLANGDYTWFVNCSTVFNATGVSEKRNITVNATSSGVLLTQPDIGAPGMELAVQILGVGLSSTYEVTTNSSDIVVGPSIFTDSTGLVVTSGARTVYTTFFIDENAENQDVEVLVNGETLNRTFRIETPTPNSGNFSGSSGTVIIGDGTNGDRTYGGSILLDSLIVPSGVTVNIDTTDPDGDASNGNQGLLPAIVVVDGPVNISGSINISGWNGGDSIAGGTGGAGGTAGPGGGGGGAGGSETGSNLGPGGNGFSGGGGGSNGGTGSSDGGDGSGGEGSPASGGNGGNGGGALLGSKVLGGQGGSDDTDEGSPGAGGSGYPLGTQATAGPGINSAGIGGAGAPGISSHACGGGGGGFATSGTDGSCSTDGGENEPGLGGSTAGLSHLVPIAGGSGASGGSPDHDGTNRQGGGGGGGGGALMLFSTENITISGTIYARGGRGGDSTVTRHASGGGGSGGTIILQSPNTTVTGTLDVSGGQPGSVNGASDGQGGAGSEGRIRVDGLGDATDIPGSATSEYVGPSITKINSTHVTGRTAASVDVEVVIKTESGSEARFANVSNANGDFSINVSMFNDLNYITVIQNTSSDTISVFSSTSLGKYDAVIPEVTLNSPANQSTTNQSSVVFNFSVYDRFLENCTLYHNASGSWTANETNNSLNNNQSNLFTTTFNNDTTIVWNVYCSDRTGNVGFGNNRTITIDTTAPTILLFNPDNNSNQTNFVLFNWSVTDNIDPTLNCSLTLNGAVNESNILVNNNNFSTRNLSLNIDGLVQWNVTCNDDAGNYNTSLTNLFYYLIPPELFAIDIFSLAENANVSWSVVNSAESYNLYISDNYSNKPSNPNITGITDTNYTDILANTTTQRYYWVESARSTLTAFRDRAVGKYLDPIETDLNLISFPLEPDTLVLENGTGTGFEFEAEPECVVSLWEKNSTSHYRSDWVGSQFVPAIGSERFRTLNMSKAYWLEANQTCNITFLGEVPLEKRVTNLGSDANYLSWHSVNNGTLPQNYNPVLLNVTPNNTFQAIDRYNPFTDTFEVTIHYVIGGVAWGWFPSFNNQDFLTMDPTRGYVFDSISTGNWTFRP